MSAGGGSCFPLWGGRRPAGRPPPQLWSLFLPFLAAGAAVLFLLAAKETAGLNLTSVKTDVKTAAKVVSEGVRVVLVRALAGGVLSVGVRRGVPVLFLRRRGLLPPPLQLLPLQGGHGRLLLVVGAGVTVNVGVRGWLPLAGLPVLQQHCRLPCLWAVALPPLSPPRRGTARR